MTTQAAGITPPQSGISCIRDPHVEFAAEKESLGVLCKHLMNLVHTFLAFQAIVFLGLTHNTATQKTNLK